MPLFSPLLRRFAAVSICAVAVAGARGELLKVSPFLPPQSAGNTPTANAQLAYGGSMRIGDLEQFRIVDPARKVGTWLKLGERDANLDVVVKQHDPSNDTVTVEHGGQTLTLQLKQPKVVSAGAAPVGMPAPPPVANVSPAVVQTVVPNPTPADEQRRLEAVAAEVARRRALREQAAQAQAAQAAAQATGQAPVTVPGMPQPQPMVTRQDMQQLQQPQRR